MKALARQGSFLPLILRDPGARCGHRDELGAANSDSHVRYFLDLVLRQALYGAPGLELGEAHGRTGLQEARAIYCIPHGVPVDLFPIIPSAVSLLLFPRGGIHITLHINVYHKIGEVSPWPGRGGLRR